MTTATVKSEIDQFLQQEESEVLCISGAWGAGKTHLWKDRVRHQKLNHGVHRYAYVSLFGLNSLAEVKQAIFENSLPIDEKGSSPTIESLKTFVRSADGFGRKALGTAFAKNYIGDLGPAFFLTIRNHLICFDDLERHGASLRIDDVLGLVSYLKEERNCRCVILLNKDKLEDGEDASFDRYLEKVCDRFLRLTPTAQELTAIAISPETALDSQIEESCIKLGISSIRTIRRCESFVARGAHLLQNSHEATQAQAVQTLTLLCWSIFDPDTAPSIEFISKKRPKSMWNKDEELSEREASWNALLDAYNFTSLDEFDEVLLEGINNGYFSAGDLNRAAEKLDRQYEEASYSQEYRSAWRDFYNSFEDDENEVLDNLISAFRKGIQHRSVVDLSSSMQLLKSFDRTQEGSQLLSEFMAANNGRPKEFFDLDADHWVREKPDDEVADALARASVERKPKRPLKDILVKIGTREGWGREDEEEVGASLGGRLLRRVQGHSRL